MKEIEINNVTVKLWVDQLDNHAREEVDNIAALPFLYHHLALMPDAHGGKGMPIGCVLATKDVVIPNAVGVDIGCGMCAVKSNLRVDEIPEEVLRKQILRGIRNRIPLGREHHKCAQDEQFMPTGFDTDKLMVVNRQLVSIRKQIGTLGGVATTLSNYSAAMTDTCGSCCTVAVASWERRLAITITEWQKT